MEFGKKPDLAHRLSAWVAQNKVFLILVLAGGLGFFALLAGVSVWQGGREEKAAAERFALIEKARTAAEAGDWKACIQHYESLYTLSKRTAFFRVLALHGIGACQRSSGDIQAAARTFERAASEPGHVDPDFSREEAKRTRREPEEKEVEKTDEPKK